MFILVSILLLIPRQTVNKNQYQRLELIGKGGSSKVYRVLRLRDYKQFALKRVELNSADDEAVRSYVAEIALLKRLSGHDCVVKLIDEELKGKAKSGILHLVSRFRYYTVTYMLVTFSLIFLCWLLGNGVG